MIQRKWIHLGIYLLATAFLPITYNACTSKTNFETPSGNSVTTSPSVVIPPDLSSIDPLSAGQKLYSNNCAICHGALPNSNRLGKTANDIIHGIQTVPAMAFLSTLTSEQIADIALALNPSLITGDPNSGVSVRIIISNRYQLAAQLKQLFVSSVNPDSNDTQIQTAIDNLITNHPEGFGGNCTRNDPGCVPNPCAQSTSCAGKLSTSQNAEINPSASAIRKGYLIQSCEQILSVDKAISNLAVQATVDITKLPDTTSVSHLSAFIYRNRPQDSGSVTQLLTLANTLQAAGMNSVDQWRMLMLALCQSSSIDLL